MFCTGKQFKGNLALKIDIREAFDTLEWSFLLKVLRQFGFSDIILHTAKLFVLVN
ncbi:RNA-directed DNA polymerase (Reverse transcriptase), partial [Trifolium medium]|nr:RNA-directed DNA polymerase (Reverse transcriptase) [Trifolium medium]